MKIFKKRTLLFLLSCTFLITLIPGAPAKVYASEQTFSNDASQQSFESTVEHIGINENLSSEDIDFIENDDAFYAKYMELAEQGYILQDINVEDCKTNSVTNNITNRRYLSSSTSYTSDGMCKIVTSTYVQPVRVKKIYNNKIFANASKIKNVATIALSYLPGKLAFIASQLFSIPTNDFAPCFNNGYMTVTTHETLTAKAAYYKENSKYYSGIMTYSDYYSISVLSYYRDSNQNPHQKTGTFEKCYYSDSFNKTNNQLEALAKKYYKSGAIDEEINENASYIWP